MAIMDVEVIVVDTSEIIICLLFKDARYIEFWNSMYRCFLGKMAGVVRRSVYRILMF